jgi:site-specific DNA-methyltransferase (adenine-specific)
MELPINQIICGDCLEVMKDWPDNCVDLVLTSPPYDDLRLYNGYKFNFEETANELYRVVRKCGIIVWIVGDMVKGGSETGNSFRQALYFKKIGMLLHDTMIYAKRGCPFPESNRYNQKFEYMFILSKGRPTTTNLLTQKTLYSPRQIGLSRNSTTRRTDGTMVPMKYETNKEITTRYNIWEYPVGYMKSTKEKSAFEHPAIFPEKLAEDHIISWSNSGDIVLDPMCGSGTTPKMAAKLHRRYIGIDISSEYCEIARQRLEAVDTGVPVKEQRTGQIPLFPTKD